MAESYHAVPVICSGIAAVRMASHSNMKEEYR